MATPTVRRLDKNHDMTFGRGFSNIATKAESTAQRVRCFLLLVLGEWFLDTGRGIPWFQAHGSAVRPIVGGPRDLAYAEAVIKAGILGIAGVASVATFSMAFDGTTRKLTAKATCIDDDGDIFNIVAVGP